VTWQFRRRSPRRPFLKSLVDALVLAALLAMIVLGLRLAGWLAPETGEFAAVDGDSLRRGAEQYRLHGIDAPELNQTCSDRRGMDYSCGREARQALRALIAGRTLACTVRDTDRYGRAVAVCMADGRDLNGEMVRQGWALAYRRHSTAYLDEETEARQARRGIWQGRFENPEQWRARHRDGALQGSAAEIGLFD